MAEGARRAALAAVALAFTLAAPAAGGFTLPEHSRIGMRAVRMLRDRGRGGTGDPYYELEGLWRVLFEAPDARSELCRAMDESSRVTRSLPVDCVAFSDLPALAADHSCSPEDLGRILDSARRAVEAAPGGDPEREHWVFRALRAAREADLGFAEEGGVPGVIGERGRDARQRIGAELNLQLTLDDPDYLARAVENLTHFQHPRASDSQTFDEWFREALGGVNATSSYALYHLLALHLARDYVEGCTKGRFCRDRGARAWRVFLAEAFALHFLEDAFAAGHFQGTSRDSERRGGLHDRANASGAAASPWGDGARYRAHGDAFMQPADEERAAAAVAASLASLGAAIGELRQGPRPELDRLKRLVEAVAPTLFAYSSCAADPSAGLDPALDPRRAVLAELASFGGSVLDESTLWPLVTRALVQVPRPATLAEEGRERGVVSARGVALAFGASVAGVWDAVAGDTGVQLTATAGLGFDADAVLSPYRDSLTLLQAVGGAEWRPALGWTALAGLRFRLPFAWGLPVVGWLSWGPSVAAFGTNAPAWAWRRSAAATRSPDPLIGNPFPGRHIFQLSLGREATFLWRLAADPTAQGCHRCGWEVHLPVVSLALRRSEHYSRWPWDWLVLDLGARLAWVGAGDAFEAGLALSVGTRPRFIFP